MQELRSQLARLLDSADPKVQDFAQQIDDLRAARDSGSITRERFVTEAAAIIESLFDSKEELHDGDYVQLNNIVSFLHSMKTATAPVSWKSWLPFLLIAGTTELMAYLTLCAMNSAEPQ